MYVPTKCLQVIGKICTYIHIEKCSGTVWITIVNCLFTLYMYWYFYLPNNNEAPNDIFTRYQTEKIQAFLQYGNEFLFHKLLLNVFINCYWYTYILPIGWDDLSISELRWKCNVGNNIRIQKENK